MILSTLQIRAQKSIEHCLLLTSKEKNKWSGKISHMPEEILERFIFSLENINASISKYLEAAVNNDPKKIYLKNLRQKFKNIRGKMFAILKQNETEDAEMKMQNDLNKIL